MSLTIEQANALLTEKPGLFNIEEIAIRGVPTRVWKAAPPSLRTVLDISRSHPWPMGVALALIGLSDVFARRGDGAPARQHAASALMLGGLIGNQVVVQDVLLCAAGKLESAATVLGKDLWIKVEDGSVMINDSKVIIADIETSNGVIHVIDAVLIPPQE